MKYLFKIGALNIKHAAMIDEKSHKVVQADFWILLTQFNGHLSQQLAHLNSFRYTLTWKN
jgi:hypothetical protein